MTAAAVSSQEVSSARMRFRFAKAPTVCVRITCALSAFALACYGALRLSRKRLNERGRDGMLAAAPPRANRHAFHTDTYPLARYARSGWRVEAPVSPPGWGRA